VFENDENVPLEASTHVCCSFEIEGKLRMACKVSDIADEWPAFSEYQPFQPDIVSLVI